MAELLSDRLFALLLREVERLEVGAEDDHPAITAQGQTPGPAPGADVVASRRESRGALKGPAAGRPTPVGAKPAAGRGGFKERADALILLTRTLEKLLELRALEASAGEDDEAETLRLREAFMRRLRALDARRAGGPRLFGDEAGTGTAPATATVAGATVAGARGRQAGPKRGLKAPTKAGAKPNGRGADGGA